MCFVLKATSPRWKITQDYPKKRGKRALQLVKARAAYAAKKKGEGNSI